MSDTVRLVLKGKSGQPIYIPLVNIEGKKYGHLLRLLYTLDVKTYNEDMYFTNYNIYYKIDGVESEYDVVDMNDCFSGTAEKDKYVNISQESLQAGSIDYEDIEEYEDVILKNNMLLKRLDLKAFIAPEFDLICFIDDSGTPYNIQQSELESSVRSEPLDLSEKYIEDIEGWLRNFYLDF